MMLAAKHFDPIIGIDIHIIQPPGPVPPVPIPHPFIGMVIDPFDYVPILGSTVLVNGIHRAQAGTAGKCLPSHIPIGGTFIKPPGNEGEIFMGSSTVSVDGDAFSYLALPSLTCQDVGMPPPPRPKKKSKTKSLVLPTSVVLPIPAGPPVLVGGAPTISLMALGMKAGMAALGRLGRGLRRLQRGAGRFGRAMRRVSDRLHSAARRAMDRLGVPPNVRNRVHRSICSVTGHPVDVATGKVFTEKIDLELPGPIPFKWERVWYSTSTYNGPLGHGWHHAYDLKLVVDEDKKVVALRMQDGRAVAFPILNIEDTYFDRFEKLTLIRDDAGYAVRTSTSWIYRFTQTIGETEEHQLTAIEDSVGNRILFFYDHKGKLCEIIDSNQRYLRIESDDLDRITAIILPHPDRRDEWFHAVRYRYDSKGDLTEVIDALDQHAFFAYENHLLTRETDRNGLNFYFEYEGTGPDARCIHTWGHGSIFNHKLSYFEREGRTVVENSLGFKTEYHWDENGLITLTIDALGNANQSNYNEYCEKISQIDALGNTTSYTYDPFGNRIEHQRPDGSSYKFTYDDWNRPLQLEDANGGLWSWEYDESGRLLKRINPLNETTSYEYYDNLLVSIIHPDGKKKRLFYDQQRNLAAVHTDEGVETRWEYDLLGRVVKVVDSNGNEYERHFDLIGKVRKIQEPDGNEKALEYNPEGQLTRIVDKKHEIKFGYSGTGRVIFRSEGDATVKFEYDTEERLVGIRNAHDSVYKFQLNKNGDVVAEIGFDGSEKIYHRDKIGRVESIERPNGLVTVFSYDAAGRVTKIEHSDGRFEEYVFRPDGEVLAVINNDVTINFERDAIGRITKEWQGEDFWVSSEYNSLGLRERMTSSLGASQQIDYNSTGNVTRMSYRSEDPAKQFPFEEDWIIQFQRDSMGFELERKLPGGIRSQWARDSLGRPLRHHVLKGNEDIRDVSYQWDVCDQLKKLIDSKRGITEFTHDTFGNLIGVKYSDGATELRVANIVGNLFKSYSQNDRRYGLAGQLLESRTDKDNIRYEYDEEGNLHKKILPNGKIWRYSWNSSGMLAKVIRPDKEVVYFIYDGLGRRIGKRFKNKVTRWVWDGNNPLHEWVEEVADSSQPIKPFITAKEESMDPTKQIYIANPPNGPPANDTDPDDAPFVHSRGAKEEQSELITWLFETNGFVPIAKILNDEKFSILTDHIGVPAVMIDVAGQPVWSADVSIFGDLRQLNGSKNDCPFRLPGQYEDSETGLFYNRFRFYDPSTGAFISQDPIGIWGGLSLYGYVKDPLTAIDPYGLVPHEMTGWVERDGQEVPGTRQDVTSGGLSQEESGRWGLNSHTERKYMASIADEIDDGDVVRMQGELDPCRPGCRPALRDCCHEHGTTMIYDASSTGRTFTFRPPHSGEFPDRVRADVVLEIREGNNVTRRRYYQSPPDSGRWKSKRCH
jgi:RHS repeat-associated protein